MRRLLWVVEILVAEGRWMPTIGVGLTKDEALQECRRYEEENSLDQYRVQKYVSSTEPCT